MTMTMDRMYLERREQSEHEEVESDGREHFGALHFDRHFPAIQQSTLVHLEEEKRAQPKKWTRIQTNKKGGGGGRRELKNNEKKKRIELVPFGLILFGNEQRRLCDYKCVNTHELGFSQGRAMNHHQTGKKIEMK